MFYQRFMKFKKMNFFNRLRQVSPLKACGTPRSVSKTVNKIFHEKWHLELKKASFPTEMVSAKF